MKSFEELSHMCKVCLMSNGVEKLSKTRRMGSLPYVVKPLVLDTNTTVSQKFMGIDKEETAMIKCWVSPLCMTLIQSSLNSQSATDIPHMESSSCYSPSTVGFYKEASWVASSCNWVKNWQSAFGTERMECCAATNSNRNQMRPCPVLEIHVQCDVNEVYLDVWLQEWPWSNWNSFITGCLLQMTKV